MAEKEEKIGRVRVALFLDKAQSEKLTAIARQNGGTLAGLVRIAVDEWIEKFKKREARLAELELEDDRRLLLRRSHRRSVEPSSTLEIDEFYGTILPKFPSLTEVQ